MLCLGMSPLVRHCQMRPLIAAAQQQRGVSTSSRGVNTLDPDHRRSSPDDCFSPIMKEAEWAHQHARLPQDRVKFAPLRRAALAVIQVPTGITPASSADCIVPRLLNIITVH